MKLKRPKIRKTAKKWYSAQFYIRKYSENAHLHGNGFKSMFLPIKILEPRFFWSLRHTSNQKTSKEKWAPPRFFWISTCMLGTSTNSHGWDRIFVELIFCKWQICGKQFREKLISSFIFQKSKEYVNHKKWPC